MRFLFIAELEMALKWGILSAGKISHDFVNALQTLNKHDHEVVAVAARDLNRAEDFAERFDIPKAYSSYLELAAGKALYSFNTNFYKNKIC